MSPNFEFSTPKKKKKKKKINLNNVSSKHFFK